MHLGIQMWQKQGKQKASALSVEDVTEVTVWPPVPPGGKNLPGNEVGKENNRTKRLEGQSPKDIPVHLVNPA